jgi:hypothetical protein
MSVTCDCSCDNGEQPSFYREETPTARKVYKCCECGGNIESGQKYHKFVGVWDGEFSTLRTCKVCKAIRDEHCPHGFVFGGLVEALWAD